LAYTKISSIPDGMIHYFLDLVSLDLTGNEFKEVPREIRNSHGLKILLLDGNKFEKFDEESFAVST
jgi:Leucine-rich repeat (LRR) protein